MSKTDEYMSSFHIYVEKRGKLKYICPNYNIYIQIVYISKLSYISKMSIDIYIQVLCPLSVLYTTLYTSSHIAYSSMYMYMSRSFSTYIVFAVTTPCTGS